MNSEEGCGNRKRGRPRRDGDEASVSSTTAKRRLLEELRYFTSASRECPDCDDRDDPNHTSVFQPPSESSGLETERVNQNETICRLDSSASANSELDDLKECAEGICLNEPASRLSETDSDLNDASGCEFVSESESGIGNNIVLNDSILSGLDREWCDGLNTGMLTFGCDVCLQCLCSSCDVCAHHDDGQCVHCEKCILDHNSECSDSESQFPGFEDLEDNEDYTDKEVLSAEDANNAAIKTDLISIALKHNMTHAVLRDLLLFFRKYQFGNLPKCASTLMKTLRTTVTRIVPPGEYWHNGLTNLVKNHVDKYKCDHVNVSFFVDGLPISNSSNTSFWPILCSFDDLAEVYLVGCYCGASKPSDANAYLQEFTDELKVLCEEGLVHGKNRISVACVKGIGDAPAKSFFLNTMGHNAYCGCHKCMVEGEMVERRMAYLETNARLRTDEDFVKRVQEGYHKEGQTVLVNIPNFGLVSCVPLDYLHLILLGVMKKLLYMWIQGPLTVRLPARCTIAISEVLVQLSLWVPKEFVRKTRSLQYVKRFKASEFRKLLLYVLPVVLKGKLPRKLYEHFLVLHVAVVIMIDPVLCEVYLDEAKEYCLYFVETFKELYGCQYVSHNVHALIHIADDVKKFGPLDQFSSFKYENFLQSLLKLIHKGRKPLQQLASRYSEFESLKYSKESQKVCLTNPVFSRLHTNGPLISDCIGPQYKLCKLPGDIEVDLSEANNCVLLRNGEVVVVRNFAYSPAGEQICIGRNFQDVSDLYTEPCKSSVLDIYSVQNLSELKVWPVSSIGRKCFRIPLEKGFAVFPLRHSGKQ